MLGVAGLDRCVPAITEAYSIAAVPGNPPGSADQGGARVCSVFLWWSHAVASRTRKVSGSV